MKKEINWYDYITVNIYWFALNARSQVLTPLILPLLIQHFVGESAKGTYVGTIRFWGLIFAVLVQSGMGLISDRSSMKWGKRRPFILAGAVGDIFLLVMLGINSGMSGFEGYWILFVIYLFTMFSSNTSHAALQGLIPDLIPEEKRGLFSGVKALFEVPISLIFVTFFISKLVQSENLWGVIIILIIVVMLSALITMFVPETHQKVIQSKLDYKPFMKLFFMTACFALIILTAGYIVQFVIRIARNLPDFENFIVIGLAGLAGMVLATIIGVWCGVAISDGINKENRRSFMWWVINRLAFLIGSTNLATFIIYFLQERYGYVYAGAAGPAAQVVSVVGLFILISVIPSGWLADRFGKKRLTMISGILAGTGTFIVVLIPNLIALFIGGGVMGIGIGLFYTSNWALGTEIVPKDKAGEYLGIANLAGAGAGAIGAYLGGPIADEKSYVVLFIIYGILFFISILAIKGIKE